MNVVPDPVTVLDPLVTVIVPVVSFVPPDPSISKEIAPEKEIITPD